MVILSLAFGGNNQILFHRSCTVLHSQQQCRKVPVSLHPHQHFYFLCYYHCHSYGYELASSWGFDLHFSNDY